MKSGLIYRLFGLINIFSWFFFQFYLQQRPALDTSKPTRSSVLFQDFQNLQRIWTHPRVLRFNSDRYEIKEQKRVILTYQFLCSI